MPIPRRSHLRSARGFAEDDCRSFGHRSRVLQMGYGAEDFIGKPVIAIVNTWSDANSYHPHFKQRVEDVKRGILVTRPMVRGFPAQLADEVASDAIAMTVFENFVQEKVTAGRSVPGLYPPTDPDVADDFAAWRAGKGH